MVFKCKICGGSLDVKQGEKITVCEYCAVRQSIPKFIEPKIEEIYNRANSYLMHNEFDKAENLYNQILFEDNSNADAYWNVLMCHYGVTYVKDPSSGKYIPTCNRTLYTPIFNDENYKKALQFADEAQKELYASDARVIDDIQKGILAVSKKEKPFDIFISYKETDIKGTRTQDSVAAQDLYNKLTAEGYKVFFSRITLEDKAGTEYEPYIYAALASSKVMITICSSRENIEAVWVKNEWSRFLSFAGKNNDKTLIPLYYNMDKKDLPDEFAHLSSYDMKAEGFEQDLIRGIKKLIPLPIMEKERREKRKKVLKKVGIGVAALFVIAAICSIPWFMKLPDYNEAMQLYYDKNYPEATWAFDKLGGYRNSKDMKDKCELSWRKSIASVVTYNYLGAGAELYSITSNGIVENDHGEAHKELELSEHGKIVSLGDNEKLYALREDGYVDNAIQNIGISENEWHNIIQISPVLDGDTNVALNSNGQMLYGDVDWAAGMAEWNKIVAFETYNDVQQGGAMVIGLTSDGKLCAVVDETVKNWITGDINTILNHFKNVVKFDFFVDLFTGNSYQEALNIVAITSDNTLVSYINGTLDEKEIEDGVDVRLVYDIYGGYKIHYLKSDGKIIDIDTNKFIFEDVVYINDEFYITRSGSVYSSYYDNGKIQKNKENAKAVIYNEWMERLD